MKIYSLLIFLFFATFVEAQVGIKTTLPLYPLHVDAKGNNPTDKVPTSGEAKDDFIVTKEGNVGIGLLDPKSRLEIDGSVKLVDGLDGTNMAVTSDENGIVRKEKLPDIKPSVIGVFAGVSGSTNVTNNTTPSPTSGFIFANATIVLSKGKWIVNWGLTIDNKANTDLWLESCLSSSQTIREEVGFKFYGNPTVKPTIASNLALKPSGQSSSTGNFDMVRGSNIIEVTADNLTIYIMLKKDGNWSYGHGSWENYLYAIPMK